ncbi:short-chain dehydrogenase reductase family [Nannochloropsis gaditana]|uniref:Short-chain dehydrogenase reductase family n=1 Tax=Nannochloropsis gaditana TaxID=72520 RepID=W7T9U4_9STRA|nr:short-chain dehydrogenase reductase family [Nannochloropsis gaditana]
MLSLHCPGRPRSGKRWGYYSVRDATHKDTTLQNKVIVITGASSGIGLALAKRACVLGAMVVLAARSEMKLTSLADELGKDSDGRLQ